MKEIVMARDAIPRKTIEQHSATEPRRRFFLKAAAASASAIGALPVMAESLADVPAREVGEGLGASSERSKFVQLERVNESTPGVLNVDPS